MISKSNIAGLIDHALTKGCRVFAPVKEDTGVILSRVDKAGVMSLDHVLTVNTLKDVMLPRCEPLADLSVDVQTATPVEEGRGPILVVGSRPCDAAAMDILDPILIGPVRDSRYARRREETVIVTLACSKADNACFCASMGYGPHDETGSDVLLLPKGEEFIVKGLTSKGRRFLDEMEIGGDREVEPDKPPELLRTVGTDRLKTWLDSNFDSPCWQTVSENCVSCGTCYYLCPTCHCYDITDEAGLSRGQRLRIWDCCSFSGFTKMASHQPRAGRYARYRQRIMHKFKYCPDNIQRVACVGDGRCIRYCPYGVDICEILESLVSKEQASG